MGLSVYEEPRFSIAVDLLEKFTRKGVITPDSEEGGVIIVFICITRWQVRFGRFGGPDICVWMEAGDVIVFNGLVWHSGLSNGTDSCVVFMYFDYEPFFVIEEMLLDDPSRFGFTKMYSEEQWKQFSADSDEKLLDIQTLGDIRSAPIATMQTLIPQDQWTLDK